MNKQLENLEKEIEEFKSEAGDNWESVVYVRDEAVKVEDYSLELAYRLMQRAHSLQPKWSFINNKLAIYKAQLLNEESYLFENTKSIDNKVASPSESNKVTVIEEQSLLAEDVELSKVEELFRNLPAWAKNTGFIFIVLPWLLFAFYQMIWASPRFESQSQVIVRQPDDMATLDASMALLTGLGMPAANTDTKLVEAYVHSNDMLEFLDEKLQLRNHFSHSDNDIFSRLSSRASSNDFLQYYIDHVLVEIDDVSSVIKISVQAFDSEFSNILNQEIVNRAEWYINSVSHQVSKEQLRFVQGEHEIVAKRLEESKANLINYQRENNLLDPTAEGLAYQEIAYTIEAQISAKKTELYAMQATMSEGAPQIKNLKKIIEALEHQLESENSRLSGNSTTIGLTVGEKMARFSDYKIDLELALQAYASSLVSLEKSRIEAYRKLQYLVVVESSTLPDENKYPEVIYNLTLMLVVLLLIYGIGRIVVATIKELN